MKKIIAIVFCLFVVCSTTTAQSADKIIANLNLQEEQIAEQGLDLDLTIKDKVVINEINEFFTRNVRTHAPSVRAAEIKRVEAILNYLKDRSIDYK